MYIWVKSKPKAITALLSRLPPLRSTPPGRFPPLALRPPPPPAGRPTAVVAARRRRKTDPCAHPPSPPSLLLSFLPFPQPQIRFSPRRWRSLTAVEGQIRPCPYLIYLFLHRICSSRGLPSSPATATSGARLGGRFRLQPWLGEGLPCPHPG